MKILASQDKIPPLQLNIDIYADHPIFHDKLDIAAAVDPKDYNVPKGPVISKEKNKVTQWMINDFESFMDRVEWLCEEHLGLICTYKHVSNDHSHYYNYIAKDDKGNVIVNIRLRLRISNHPAKRTSSSQQQKKDEINSEKLQEMFSKQQISKMDPYPKVIIVNDDIYNDYDEAFADVEQQIEGAVIKMKKRGKVK